MSGERNGPGQGPSSNERGGDEGDSAEGRRPPETGREIVPEVGPALAAMVEKTSRFSREFVATMISLASAAFGLVAALAWNTAITKWLQTWLTTDSKQVSGYFVYAVIVTLIGVMVIVMLARLATRLNAEPIEFKYPGLSRR
jgi:Na+/phosphate symporter